MVMNLLRIPFFYFGAIGLAGFLAISCSGERSSATYARQPGEAPRPVIVELFTSEGCSSCPPADALLKKLSEQQPLQGIQIVALEEHVDYWNHLGWADPFSSDDFSQRQNAYAQIFGRDGVYTPQMVVDGQTEFVGSHSAAARDAILKAAAQPKLDVALGFSASATPDKVVARCPHQQSQGNLNPRAGGPVARGDRKQLAIQCKGRRKFRRTAEARRGGSQSAKNQHDQGSSQLPGKYPADSGVQLENGESFRRGFCGGEGFAENHRRRHRRRSSLITVWLVARTL